MTNIKEKYYLPTNEDYRGSVIALQRLEDVFSLKPFHFSSGNLSTKYPSRSLNGK